MQKAKQDYADAVKEDEKLAEKESNEEYCWRHYMDASRWVQKTKDQLADARRKWEKHKNDETEATYDLALRTYRAAHHEMDRWEALWERRRHEQGLLEDEDEDEDKDDS